MCKDIQAWFSSICRRRRRILQRQRGKNDGEEEEKTALEFTKPHLH